MDDTENRIRTAAARLMAERGFDGTSVQAVADGAGVNKALVFYYFGSKAKLFDQVLDGHLSGLHDRLRAVGDDRGPPEERLHRLLDAYMDYVAEQPSYPRLVQRELANAQGRHDRIAEYNRKNYELIEPLIRSLPGRTRGPAAAHQLFTSFVGMVLHYFINEPTLRPLIREPLGRSALRKRRDHIHWMVDAVIDRLRARG